MKPSRSPFMALLVVSSLAFAAGCSASPDVGSVSFASTRLSAQELARTKAELRRITTSNMTRTDNLDEVRVQVEPLVAKLAAHFGDRPASDKLPLVAGAWRQLWSDYPYPMAPFLTMDLSQVYQVVSEDGYYWNVGESSAFSLFGVTGVLRGRYEEDGSKLRIAFTESGFRIGRLPRRTQLVPYAESLEDGSLWRFGLPGGGPVGVSGTLETLYVDEDLRVERGTQDEQRAADGSVTRPAIGEKYFVLDRVTSPVR
ncbi:MAG: PAP/fibrillin family protein [Polyangiaceae bacterium]